MTGDRYTKVVLTIIAGCLVWIALWLVILTGGGPVPVVLSAGHRSIAVHGDVDVNLARMGGRSFPSMSIRMPALPVEVTNEVDVLIR